jgi:hypothetical protein
VAQPPGGLRLTELARAEEWASFSQCSRERTYRNLGGHDRYRSSPLCSEVNASPRRRSSARAEADNCLRVNPIVGSFKPARSQSREKRLKGTVVLAALQQALRREATTSRRKSTSSQMAQCDDLGATGTSLSAGANSAMPPRLHAPPGLEPTAPGARRRSGRLRRRSHDRECRRPRIRRTVLLAVSSYVKFHILPWAADSSG